jgi:hypothetical protein
VNPFLVTQYLQKTSSKRKHAEPSGKNTPQQDESYMLQVHTPVVSPKGVAQYVFTGTLYRLMMASCGEL